jgi:hypothetical protein
MRFILAVLLLVAMPAFAQQPQQPASPMEQALGQKLMEEINSNIQLRTQLVGMQDQIKDLQAKLKPQDKPPEPQK